MAELPGFRVQAPAGGVNNPLLGTALFGFELDWWPPSESLASATERAAVQSNLPVATTPRALAARLAGRYQDDFYNRIHVNPGRIDLGNVVSEQVDTVRVWNAYFVPRDLLAISGLEEGLVLQGPDAPLTQAALAENEYFVSVSPAGPVALDAEIVWEYDLQDAGLPITGTRVIAWPITPDWSSPVTETLAWATDILQSPSGVEQRRALRLAPRRALAGAYLAYGRERQLLQSLLAGWGARQFAVPLVAEVQLLPEPATAGDFRITAETANLDFNAGGLVMLHQSAHRWEVAQIQAIDGTGLDLERALTQSWPVGTRVYPVRSAQLNAQPEQQRLGDRASRFTADFTLTEPSDWPAELPAAAYLGEAVLEQWPEESRDLTEAAARLLLELDNGSRYPRRLDTADREFRLREHAWLAQNEQLAELRRLAYALRGRQGALWVPTFASDFTLAQTLGSASQTLVVENVGYTTLVNGRPERQHLRIELASGAVFYRQITAAAEVDDELEQLQLDAALGEQVAPAQVRAISYMLFCRADSDTLTIDHLTDTLARVSLVFREVRDREL